MKYKLSFFSRPRHRVPVRSNRILRISKNEIENTIYCYFNGCLTKFDNDLIDSTLGHLGSIVPYEVKEKIGDFKNYLSKQIKEANKVNSESTKKKNIFPESSIDIPNASANTEFVDFTYRLNKNIFN